MQQQHGRQRWRSTARVALAVAISTALLVSVFPTLDKAFAATPAPTRTTASGPKIKVLAVRRAHTTPGSRVQVVLQGRAYKSQREGGWVGLWWKNDGGRWRLVQRMRTNPRGGLTATIWPERSGSFYATGRAGSGRSAVHHLTVNKPAVLPLTPGFQRVPGTTTSPMVGPLAQRPAGSSYTGHAPGILYLNADVVRDLKGYALFGANGMATGLCVKAALHYKLKAPWFEVGCITAVSYYFWRLRDTVINASRTGKCVQVEVVTIVRLRPRVVNCKMITARRPMVVKHS